MRLSEFPGEIFGGDGLGLDAKLLLLLLQVPSSLPIPDQPDRPKHFLLLVTHTSLAIPWCT